MANNCLVTKLKGEVNADLPFFNGVRVVIPAGNTSPVTLRFSSFSYGLVAAGVRVLALSNCSLSAYYPDAPSGQKTDTGTDLTVRDGLACTFSAVIADTTKDAEVVLFNYDKFDSMGSVITDTVSKFIFKDVEKYKYAENLGTTLGFNCSDKPINVDSFFDGALFDPTAFTIFSGKRDLAMNNGAEGNIESLSVLTNVTWLSLLNANQMQGDIVDFAKGLAAKGSVSGTLTNLILKGSSVTYGGQSCASMDGEYTLTWDGGTWDTSHVHLTPNV